MTESLATNRGWRPLSVLALSLAVVLLVIGLAMGVYNERVYRVQKAREATVQADIVAASVTAALAFDDAKTITEYVNALRVNREVEAVGVYGEDGRLVATFSRSGADPPPPAAFARRAELRGAKLSVVRPVVENGARLGRVYLRLTVDPVSRRVIRYGAGALLVIMAALVLAVFSAAHSAMSRANADLKRHAEQLSEANLALRVEMEEREKAEHALRQSQKMEAVGQLTGGVAHDFNNLLMVASSGLELLDRTTDEERRARLRDGVRRALDRGASLTRQLLAFSRKAALKPQVVDLGAQILGLQVLLERTLREDIHVELRPAPDLWPVEIDPGELEVAVLNCAVNARDAMPSGGIIVVAAVNRPDLDDGFLKGDFVELSIRDTGSGMTAETQARVFEPFFTTKPVGQGTGLGLSQIYGFARASGGDVRIESAPGKGATVSIFLPRSLGAPPAAESGPVAATAQGEGRVLLVEDDDDVAQAVSAMLGELGYACERVDGAAAALARLRAGGEFDLVLSDMIMPGDMNGLDLANSVRRDWPDLPVLLTTGYSEAAAAAAADGLRVLSKPYDLATLGKAVNRALSRRLKSGADAS